MSERAGHCALGRKTPASVFARAKGPPRSRQVARASAPDRMAGPHRQRRKVHDPFSISQARLGVVLEAGRHAKHRCLAATRRRTENNELTLSHVEFRDDIEVIRVDLGHFRDRDRHHQFYFRKALELGAACREGLGVLTRTRTRVRGNLYGTGDCRFGGRPATLGGISVSYANAPVMRGPSSRHR